MLVVPYCPCSEGAGAKVFVGLFDVNQWYHSQMPRFTWKAKGARAWWVGVDDNRIKCG